MFELKGDCCSFYDVQIFRFFIVLTELLHRKCMHFVKTMCETNMFLTFFKVKRYLSKDSVCFRSIFHVV